MTMVRISRQVAEISTCFLLLAAIGGDISFCHLGTRVTVLSRQCTACTAWYGAVRAGSCAKEPLVVKGLGLSLIHI